jgi:hypothetical protein
LNVAIPTLLPAYRVATTLINEADLYWYANKEPLVLPVLRAQFDDPAQTWLHIDPATGRVLNQIDASQRRYRWLFSALHRWDFYWLLNHRPLWDAVMWTFSIAGLIVAISGIVIGWRRLSRSRS